MLNLNNKLNLVNIENTFIVNDADHILYADRTTYAALTVSDTITHLENVSVTATLEDNNTFIMVGYIDKSAHYRVMFVEMLKPSSSRLGTDSFRVEMSTIKLTGIEYAYLIGGDELVNSKEFMCQIDKHGVMRENCDIISNDEYIDILFNWWANEANTNMDMTKHVANMHKVVKVSKGVIVL